MLQNSVMKAAASNRLVSYKVSLNTLSNLTQNAGSVNKKQIRTPILGAVKLGTWNY